VRQTPQGRLVSDVLKFSVLLESSYSPVRGSQLHMVAYMIYCDMILLCILSG